ncbi:LysE family translocator [Sanguibacter suaedae]|uniref:LysE family transporter n=1 Tax=Sanguibacter suaedae TaxID=2795737 RepID=A0A934I9B5_9MICO|nr:LysE family transporter [Sanguibacter suaedae]MBI9113738.1 LysE family transporter [Sanguibacter suaedae]
MTLVLLALTVLPFVVSPGASFAITIDAASSGDRRAPVKVWAGTALGITVIASIAALSGVARFLAENATARSVFGVAGGTVLVILGVGSLVKARRSTHLTTPGPRPARQLVLWAFLALITNVKALSLYALVVPGLGTDDLAGPALFFLFAGVHVVMLLLWLTLVGEGVRRIPSIGTSPRVRAGLLSVAAVTLIVIGTLTLAEALR